MGKGRVGDETIERLARVRLTGSRFQQVRLDLLGKTETHQLRQQEKIVVIRRKIQSMNRENIAPLPKQIDPVAQVELLEKEHVLTGILLGGAGIPARLSGDVPTNDLRAIEIGDESIVVFHLQGQGVEGFGIFRFEGHPQEGRSVPSEHLLAYVGSQLTIEAEISIEDQAEHLHLREAQILPGYRDPHIAPPSFDVLDGER